MLEAISDAGVIEENYDLANHEGAEDGCGNPIELDGVLPKKEFLECQDQGAAHEKVQSDESDLLHFVKQMLKGHGQYNSGIRESSDRPARGKPSDAVGWNTRGPDRPVAVAVRASLYAGAIGLRKETVSRMSP